MRFGARLSSEEGGALAIRMPAAWRESRFAVSSSVMILATAEKSGDRGAHDSRDQMRRHRFDPGPARAEAAVAALERLGSRLRLDDSPARSTDSIRAVHPGARRQCPQAFAADRFRVPGAEYGKHKEIERPHASECSRHGRTAILADLPSALIMVPCLGGDRCRQTASPP